MSRIKAEKRTASLRYAIDWIARNDEDRQMDASIVGESVSVLLVADLWGLPPEEVARRVVRLRKKL